MFFASKAMLDMNRLSEELACINRQPAEVALLFSWPSIFWSPNYSREVRLIYESLYFMGVKVTFISERQLATGTLPAWNNSIKCIILPESDNVSQVAVEGLEKLSKKGTTVVRVGAQCLNFDEYHRKRTLDKTFVKNSPIVKTEGQEKVAIELRKILREQGIRSIELLDAKTGRPAWGIEYRVVDYNKFLLVPIVNLTSNPITVLLPFTGTIMDLISDSCVDRRLTVAPMQTFLLQVKNNQLDIK
jgi:hypothetical protein